MNNEDKLNIEKLRKRADDILKKKSKEGELKLSEVDLLRLIHILEVYEVELEMQKEELLRTKEEGANINKKYDELFDLHNRFIIHMLKTGRSTE